MRDKSLLILQSNLSVPEAGSCGSIDVMKAVVLKLRMIEINTLCIIYIRKNNKFILMNFQLMELELKQRSQMCNPKTSFCTKRYFTQATQYYQKE